VGQAGLTGVSAEALAARLGTRTAGLEAALGRLASEGTIVVARAKPPVLVPSAEIAAIEARAREMLAAAGGIGIPLAEFAARIVPPSAGGLRDFYLGTLRRSGVLRESGGRALAADAAPLEDALTGRLAELYRRAGFAAPSPQEAAAALAADPRVVQGIVGFLVDQGRLARIGGKWVVHRQLLDDVASSLREWGVESFDVGAFKDRFGLTRKLAIPILEWLDSQRVTRREGDRRRVVRPRADTNRSA
jgi:selenocysteine-specific elongation factor